MRPQEQHSFQTSTASKLDRLEVVVALLERDAVNGRALYAEMGAPLAAVPVGRRPRWRRRWHRLTDASDKAFRATVRLATAMVRSRRLRSAVRATYAFLVDFAVVLAFGAAAVVVLAAAFALTAPPV